MHQLLLFARESLLPLKTGRSSPAFYLLITDSFSFPFSKRCAMLLINFIIENDKNALGKDEAVFVL